MKFTWRQFKAFQSNRTIRLLTLPGKYSTVQYTIFKEPSGGSYNWKCFFAGGRIYFFPTLKEAKRAAEEDYMNYKRKAQSA